MRKYFRYAENTLSQPGGLMTRGLPSQTATSSGKDITKRLTGRVAQGITATITAFKRPAQRLGRAAGAVARAAARAVAGSAGAPHGSLFCSETIATNRLEANMRTWQRS
eukprot:15450768-Alexandrium_andersonii.AAC.1